MELSSTPTSGHDARTPGAPAGAAPAAVVIGRALAAFNRGDAHALTPQAAGTDPAAPAQERLGCADGRRCAEVRQMPFRAGERRLALLGVRELGDGRSVCEIEASDGTRLVGLYAVADGVITAACHYFSDVATLERIGVLPQQRADGALGEPADTAPATLAGELHATRLAHRRHRLRLAIRALDQRVQALGDEVAGVPTALIHAIRDFQQELRALDESAHASEPAPWSPSLGGAPPSGAAPDADDAYAGTNLVGRCSGCGLILFTRDPHRWLDDDTGRRCAMYDAGARLLCESCLPAA